MRTTVKELRSFIVQTLHEAATEKSAAFSSYLDKVASSAGAKSGKHLRQWMNPSQREKALSAFQSGKSPEEFAKSIGKFTSDTTTSTTPDNDDYDSARGYTRRPY